MKKLIVIASMVLFVLAVMSSCKSKECPAYSDAGNKQTEQVARA